MRIISVTEGKLDLVRERKQAESFQQRITDMDDCLKKTTSKVREFDNDLVRKLLQNIRVINEELIEIQSKYGIVIKQWVSYCE